MLKTPVKLKVKKKFIKYLTLTNSPNYLLSGTAHHHNQGPYQPLFHNPLIWYNHARQRSMINEVGGTERWDKARYKSSRTTRFTHQ